MFVFGHGGVAERSIALVLKTRVSQGTVSSNLTPSAMKFIGVDYGAKRIGVAVSDDGGRIAFPRVIVENTKGAIGEIVRIVAAEGAEHIVVGESLNASGEENEIMKEARPFAASLADASNLPFSFEKEFFTSVEARRFQTEGRADDRAAAIMLQRYLDKINNPQR